jgi:hypothetical protein
MAQYIARSYKISIKKALAGDYSQESREAIIDEINNMIAYQVGHYVHYKDIPPQLLGNILLSFMFLKHKHTTAGDYERTKARLVGNGKKQKAHMYDIISSSTVALIAVLLLLNIASLFLALIASYDVKAAFLHPKFGPSDPTTYLRINKEITAIWVEVDPSAIPFVDEKGELILELDRFIYGLKQSPYKFQINLTDFLKKVGYHQLVNDECLFMKRNGTDWSILSTHVDDILQITSTTTMIRELHQALLREYTTVTFHSSASSYTGMSIKRSHDKKTIYLRQEGLTEQILTKYLPESDKEKTKTTPASDNLMHSTANSESTDRNKYLSLVMSLMYLARLTRPDILLPVTYLATKSANPTSEDLKHAHRILHYLNGTRDKGIRINCTELQIYGSCDASFGTHIDGKSHTGYILSLGENKSYLSAKSVKQKLVALSSTDAELIALVEFLKQAIWMRNLIQEIALTPLQPIIVEQDNDSAIIMVTDVSKYRRSKHMLVKISYARTMVKSGKLIILYVPTENLTADILTKPLHGSAFFKFRDVLLAGND